MKKLLVLLSLLAIGYCTKNSDFPELNLTGIQLIQYWGYPAEMHYTTTDDGYILGMFRIPYGKGESPGSGRTPVFFQHGLDDSGCTWILNMPYQSAGFVFADAGYDVWLGNFRGSTYSRNHTTLSTDSKEYWNFSQDEMAHHDLPAMINYVMSATGKQRLFYVGHSMGTTTAFMEMTANSVITPHIISMHALGPVAKVHNIKGLLRWLSPFSHDLDWLKDNLGDGELTTNSAFYDEVADTLCEDANGLWCSEFIFLMCGPNTHEINETRMPVYLNHTPGGTSVNTLNQYAEEIEPNTFQWYDFINTTVNQQYYGSNYPPDYDIANFVPPLYLWYGDDDWLADPTDVEGYIVPNAPSLVQANLLPNMAHLDYVWGINAYQTVYQPILKIMETQS